MQVSVLGHGYPKQTGDRGGQFHHERCAASQRTSLNAINATLLHLGDHEENYNISLFTTCISCINLIVSHCISVLVCCNNT